MANLKRIATWLFVAVILTAFLVPVATSQNFLGLVPTDRLLGRDTAGTGQVEPLTVSGALSFTGSGGITASAADILTQLLTVDGSGSGLDADLLDGMSSGSFVQALTAGTAIDVSGTTNVTVDWDSTEVAATTWGSGAGFAWT